MNEDEQIEARKRAQEHREMAEEECPNGGFLFGNLGFEQDHESRQR